MSAAGEQAIYGIAVRGLGGGGGPVAPPDWPRWEVGHRVGTPSGREGMSVWDDRAWIGIGAGGEFHLDRAARRVEFVAPEPWSPEALLHPGFAPAAAVIAHWMGRAALHCAAVVIDGRAWALLGERGSGKSTTAAHLARLGCDVLTDDLLVVDGETCFAGPRAIDLREDAAAVLGGRELGRLGNRERWRVALAGDVLSAPLGGWVDLCWGEAAAWQAAGIAERLAALDRAVGLPLEGERSLQLADRPMFRMRRERTGEACLSARSMLDALVRARED